MVQFQFFFETYLTKTNDCRNVITLQMSKYYAINNALESTRMAFREYTETIGRGGKARASIWKSGQIGLNKGAVSKHKLSEDSYVVLYYDEDSNRIGIELLKGKTKDWAVPIKLRQGSAVIPSKQFMDFFEIDYSMSKKYDLKKNPDDGLLVIELHQGSTESLTKLSVT